MMKAIDLTGQRFGRLTVIRLAEGHRKPNGTMVRRWVCKCDCGNECIVSVGNLKNGSTKSCGCLRKEVSKELSTNSYFRDTGKLNKRYNTFDLSGLCGVGYTRKGEKYYFDLEDYQIIKDYCWYLNDNGYLIASLPNSNKKIRFHRLILSDELNKNEEQLVDHINHNKLDNRKQNLRLVNYQKNAMNMKIKTTNTSGVTGVIFDNNRQKWVASIMVDYKTIFLGRFPTFKEAFNARKKAEEKYFGEYSYNNSMKLLQEINI